MVTHPSIDWAHGCLTSVIGPWMVAPCQRGSQVNIQRITKNGNLKYCASKELNCYQKVIRSAIKFLYLFLTSPMTKINRSPFFLYKRAYSVPTPCSLIVTSSSFLNYRSAWMQVELQLSWQK